MTTDTTPNMYEEVFQNVRKAAEASVKMQQDMFQQWSKMWPGFPAPQSAWTDKIRDFQKEWTSTVSDLARRHQDVLNQQYQAALDSLEEALRVTASSNPEEFRQRNEQLCRKTLDCMRDVSEAQMKEFQEAMSKWSELVTKVGS